MDVNVIFFFIVCLCLCVCVTVRERERETETQTNRVTEIQKEKRERESQVSILTQPLKLLSISDLFLIGNLHKQPANRNYSCDEVILIFNFRKIRVDYSITKRAHTPTPGETGLATHLSLP